MSKPGKDRSTPDDFNQLTVHRVLRLIVLMRRSPRRTRKEFAELLEVSERSIYRYFNLIESLGYVVESDFDRHTYIAGEELNEPFTSDEAQLLKSLLEEQIPNHPLSHSILRKLNKHRESEHVADSLVQASLAQILTSISRAIHQRKRLLLVGYHSVNSNSIANRLVEPIELMANHNCLSAYEVASKQNKFFRLDRISLAEVQDEAIELNEMHRACLPDIFGFSYSDEDEGLHRLELNLSLKAAMFLRTENPISIPYIRRAKENDRFLLEGPCVDLRPAARFIRGFDDPNDIWVLGDAAVIAYLAES